MSPEYPQWAPEGKGVVFTHITSPDSDHESQRLFTVARDGAHLEALPIKGRAPSAEGPNFGDAGGSFSPDGRYIAYTQANGHVKFFGSSDQLEQFNIYVVTANGTRVRQVTHQAPYVGDIGGVRWSPDGKRLVFARLNSAVGKPAGGRALFTINVDGTGEQQLTPWKLGAGGTADWSAAGDRIVFRAVADEESGIGNFFSIHADGFSLTQVTHFSNTVISHQVGYSPDGDWIVFGKQDDKSGINQVFVARASDGEDMRQLTHSTTASSSPDWTG